LANDMQHRALAAIPLLVYLGFAGAVASTLYKEHADGYSPATIPSALISKHHPKVALPSIDGFKTGGLSDAVLNDKLTVVNVFASWCVPCRPEHPYLMRLAKDPRVSMVAINYKDAPENAVSFLDAYGNPFIATGSDATGQASMEWGVDGVPETFIVDRCGAIVFKQVGPIDEQVLDTKIRPLLDQSLATSSVTPDRLAGMRHNWSKS